jgi:hypothetical protein
MDICKEQRPETKLFGETHRIRCHKFDLDAAGTVVTDEPVEEEGGKQDE